MASITVERVLREIESLTPDERRQIRQHLEAQGPQPEFEESEHAALYRQLVEEGVLAKAPNRVTDSSAYSRRRPIEIKGKPLSQTIVEERR